MVNQNSRCAGGRALSVRRSVHTEADTSFSAGFLLAASAMATCIKVDGNHSFVGTALSRGNDSFYRHAAFSDECWCRPIRAREAAARHQIKPKDEASRRTGQVIHQQSNAAQQLCLMRISSVVMSIKTMSLRQQWGIVHDISMAFVADAVTLSMISASHQWAKKKQAVSRACSVAQHVNHQSQSLNM